MNCRFLMGTVVSTLVGLSSLPEAVAQMEPPPPPVQWGEIPIADLAMKSYPADTNAAAVILCDYGETVMNDDIGLTFRKHERIKILKTAGYAWATHSVWLYEGEHPERIDDIEGVTYSLDAEGKIVRTKMEDKLLREDVDGERARYRFTLPALTPGCVIEFRYSIRTSHNMWSIRNWEFQTGEPVLWSEYRVTTPKNVAYVAVQHGYTSFFISEGTETMLHLGGESRSWVGDTFPICNLYRWVLRNAPALREEPFMTTVRDYFVRVDIQLAEFRPQWERSVTIVLKTWDMLVKELLEDDQFGKRCEPTASVHELARQVTAGLITPEARMSAVYDYVRNIIVEDPFRAVNVARDLDEVVRTRRGTSAETTLLMLAMLKSVGIEGQPVFLSTRSHGQVQKEYPIISQFNHVLAVVRAGHAQYFLDASNPLCASDILPWDVLNTQGLVVAPGPAQWVTITTPKQIVHQGEADVSVSERGAVTGRVEREDEEYSSLALRREFRGKSDVDLARYVFDADRTGISLDSVVVTGRDSLVRPVCVRTRIASESYAQVAGDLLYVNPMVIDRLSTNPFKSPKRVFPVDMACGARTTTVVTITLPDGFDVKEFPPDREARIGAGDASFLRKTTVDGRQVRVETQLAIEKSEYPPNMYEQLKTFYEHMTAWQSEQIVLQRTRAHPFKEKK